MLTQLHLKNYRCFEDVTIPFGMLTVLVGPNATGKSSVLRALNPRHGVPVAADVRHWSSDVCSVHFEYGGQDFEFVVESSPGLPYRGEFQHVHLTVDACRRDTVPDSANRLETQGSNLANVVFNMPRKVSQTYSDRYCELVSAFQSVEPKGHGSGKIGLEFQDRWSTDTWYHADQISDGSILTAAYLVLAFQTKRPKLITIEEPEHGLHPSLIGHMVGVFRELVAMGIQVVISTHSSVLLDHVKPKEVVFLRRDADKGSVIVQQAPSGEEGWSDYLKSYDDSLGAAWLSGGLGG